METPKKLSPEASGSRSKRSRRSSGTPELPPVFIDRSLGKDIARALAAAGIDVRHMADVYDDDGQHIGDDQWIADCAANGWIAFSKDKNVVRAHAPAISQHGAILFLLPDQGMSGAEQIIRYLENRYRIAMKARKGGPAVYKVYVKSVDLIGP